uniref:(northern house mosquito) hypothetical protein n=1 Tax=Culex pipiens TaxID=7175 RepID=A0A8D8NRY5_CULPI
MCRNDHQQVHGPHYGELPRKYNTRRNSTPKQSNTVSHRRRPSSPRLQLHRQHQRHRLDQNERSLQVEFNHVPRLSVDQSNPHADRYEHNTSDWSNKLRVHPGPSHVQLGLSADTPASHSGLSTLYEGSRLAHHLYIPNRSTLLDGYQSR